MKKSQQTTLDKLWREVIKERDEVCQYCGQKTNLNCHHIVGRRNRTLRWSHVNGILLCAGCHTFRMQSAHQNPRWFQEWFKKNWPERDEHLREWEQVIIEQEYEEVKDDLETAIRYLKAKKLGIEIKESD